MTTIANSENSAYELVGVAHRYFHGEGAIEKSIPNAMAALTKAHEKGNPDAARNAGHALYEDFKQTSDVKTLESALSWYEKGYKKGDIDAGVYWAKYSTWYGRHPDVVRNAIAILLKHRDSHPSTESFIEDACSRGYDEAC